MDVGLPVRLMSYLRIFDTCDDGENNMKKNVTNSRYKVGVKETYVSSEPVPMSNGILFNPGSIKIGRWVCLVSSYYFRT